MKCADSSGKNDFLGLLRSPKRVILELNSPVQSAQRYATFQPLFGKKWQTKSVPFLLESTRNIWQQQLARLSRMDGLPGVEAIAERQLAYMLNCPGCTVLEHPRMLFCQHWHFCPFCHARYIVMDAFCRLADVLGLGPVQRDAPAGHLLGIRARVLIPTDETAPLVTQNFVKDRRLYRELTKATGGWTSFAVQPSTVTGFWELSRLELLIVPRLPDSFRMQMALAGCHSYYQQALPRRHRTDLASLVGTICEYPSMLLLGPVSEVSTILWAIHGLRMRSAFGSLWAVQVPDPVDSQLLIEK